MVGSLAWARISHRQRLVVQPVLQGKYQSDPFEYGISKNVVIRRRRDVKLTGVI